MAMLYLKVKITSSDTENWLAFSVENRPYRRDVQTNNVLTIQGHLYRIESLQSSYGYGYRTMLIQNFDIGNATAPNPIRFDSSTPMTVNIDSIFEYIIGWSNLSLSVLLLFL